MITQKKKRFKILEDMERRKIDYSKLTYKSGDKVFCDFNRFGLLSCFYLRLMIGNISINNAKLILNEFR